MPERFANGDAQSGYTDLSDLDDNRTVGPLRRMMSRTDRMMRVRLMRIVDVVMRMLKIVMRIVYIMMRIVNIVVRSVKAVMRIVNWRVRAVHPG